MKINPNFVRRNVAGEMVIIPTGEAAQYFNGLITTNDVASFIWENLENCNTPEEMIQLVQNEFDADEKTIANDVTEFLNTLREVEMIDFE